MPDIAHKEAEVAMQTAYSIVMLIFVFLFYLANPKNKVNQWGCLGVFFMWLGIVKQAIMFEIIPFLHANLGMAGLDVAFSPVWSAFTWAIYVFALPMMVIAALHFAGMAKTKPKSIAIAKVLLGALGLCLSLVYTPLNYGIYQESSQVFWLAFGLYNSGMGIVVTALMSHGIQRERNPKLKKQKRQVALVVTPPLYYWLISVFIIRILNLSAYFELWQLNVFIMLLCVIIFIYSAFRDGFMGLKLISQNYDWNTSVNLMNASTEYANHMIKQQTSTMELCIDQLKSHYISPESSREVRERLDILSRSISALTDYTNRTRRHSQIILLTEETCRIADMLADIISVTRMNHPGISIVNSIGENVFLHCDRVHMTEVFANIVTNAVEAIGDEGLIEITGLREKSKLRLRFRDSGEGIDGDIMKEIFKPHFSTKKSKEKNFGLGLYYCMNVVTKHGGSISAQSEQGRGTTMTVTLPAKRIVVFGDAEELAEGAAQDVCVAQM